MLNINKDESLTPEKKRKRRRTLFGLSLGYFVDQGEDQAISVLFPTLQAIWGLSYTHLGIIATVRRLLQALSAPLWGYAADKWSRKNIIFFGTGIWGIWTLAVGFTQAFTGAPHTLPSGSRTRAWFASRSSIPRSSRPRMLPAMR